MEFPTCNNLVPFLLLKVYPTSLRATGSGIACAVGRIGGMICPIVAVGLVSGCHQTAAIVLLEIVTVFSVVSIQLFPFETKGRELTDTVTSTTTLVSHRK